MNIVIKIPFQYNLKNKSELAEKRFREDLMFLNLFFDPPIITRITLKMRITIFDQVCNSLKLKYYIDEKYEFTFLHKLDG